MIRKFILYLSLLSFVFPFLEIFSLNSDTSNQILKIIKVDNDRIDDDNVVPINQLKIISFKKKDEWELVAKYNIGNKKNDDTKFEGS